MLTKEQVLNETPKIKMLANGGFGAGKTYFAMSFPKWAYAMIEPNGILTAKTNPHLLDNMVRADTFIPSPDEDIKVTFERLEKFVREQRDAARKGEIETLIIDNLTYLSVNRWEYINKYEKLLTKSGELDVRGMYGTLGRWLYKFTLTELLTFPGNLVVTCHEMNEHDEAMADKVDKTSPVVSNIVGGFRDKAAGLFNASIFLEVKRTGENAYKHIARCRKGNLRDAKNNLGLPEIVESVSYQKIIEAINKSSSALPTPATVPAVSTTK
jgi:hypothetical protein